jgi:hypothetical protein
LGKDEKSGAASREGESLMKLAGESGEAAMRG